MFKTKGTFHPIETSSSWLANNKFAFSYCFSKQGEGKRRWKEVRGLIKTIFADVYILK